MYLIFFKIYFIAFKKLPYLFANRAEYIPGLPFRAFMHRPESSDITGHSTYCEKYLTFNFELEINDLPVSFGLLIFKDCGDIFLYLLEIK